MGKVADLRKPLDLSVLKDKSVLVTGGASGIGSLIASRFAGHGQVLNGCGGISNGLVSATIVHV